MRIVVIIALAVLSCRTGTCAPEADGVLLKKGDILVYQHQSDTEDEAGDSEAYGWDSTEKFRSVRKSWESVREVTEDRAPGRDAEGEATGVQWSANNSVDYGYVEREDVTVPAGLFKNCSKAVHVTSDDYTITWWYPGFGLVKKEHVSAGPLMRETQELKEIRVR